MTVPQYCIFHQVLFRLKAFHLLKVHQVDLSGNTGMYVVELMGADKNGPIWRRLDRTGPV